MLFKVLFLWLAENVIFSAKIKQSRSSKGFMRIKAIQYLKKISMIEGFILSEIF